MGSITYAIPLPGGLGNAGNVSVARILPEADAAYAKKPYVPVAAPAESAPIVYPRRHMRAAACRLLPQECCEMRPLPIDERETGHGSRW